MINKNALLKEVASCDKQIAKLDEKIAELKQKSSELKKERNEFARYLAMFDDLEKRVTEKLESKTHSSPKKRVENMESDRKSNDEGTEKVDIDLSEIIDVTEQKSSEEEQVNREENELDIDQYFNH